MSHPRAMFTFGHQDREPGRTVASPSQASRARASDKRGVCKPRLLCHPTAECRFPTNDSVKMLADSELEPDPELLMCNRVMSTETEMKAVGVS